MGVMASQNKFLQNIDNGHHIAQYHMQKYTPTKWD